MSFLKLSFFFLTIVGCHSEQKQNIVFILVDDLGWNDLGYSGSTFHESPNLDAFSRESIRFTNAYAPGSVCSPSRAAILTGKHPARINITDWIPGADPNNERFQGPQDLHALPDEEVTLAEVLQENGYRTFFAGKWHLGGAGSYPEDHGFEINIGGHDKGQPPGGYYSPYNNPKLKDGPEGEYLTDRLTDESIEFIENSGRDPFFLFLSYYTVHTPIQACTRHLKRFETKLQNMGELEVLQEEEGRGMSTLHQRNPAYASMIYALDENIGRLIDKLKEEGLYDQTTIIFTSDNGGLSTLKAEYDRVAPTSVRPLRGGKGWLYEGGIRVPLLIKPAGFENREKVIDIPVVGHDFYPTICSMADLELKEANDLDGMDISPLWKKDKLEEDDPITERAILWYYPHYHGSGWTPGAAIRQGDWKLNEFYDPPKVELYHLESDEEEVKDVKDNHPEIANQLQMRIKEYLELYNAGGPTINDDFQDE